MSDEKTQSQLTIDHRVNAFHLMGDSCYEVERKAYSDQYAEHLYRALMGECNAKDEFEFEDGRYFDPVSVQERAYAPTMVTAPVVQAPAAPVKEPVATVRTETVRAFNRKRLPWLVAYCAVIVIAVVLLAVLLPGSAWEKDVPVDTDAGLTQQAEAAAIATMRNTISLPDGTSQVIVLEPYQEEVITTNWFDEMCDWISNVIGG